MAEKRARKELAELSFEASRDFSVTLKNEDDPLHWDVVVYGPSASPYEGGRFLLQVEIPTKYPFSPPSVMFCTEIYHCNLGLAAAPNRCNGGQLLQNGQKWHPSKTVREVIARILALMVEPEVHSFPLGDEGATGEATKSENTLLLDMELAALWKSDRTQFEQTAREWTNLLARIFDGAWTGGTIIGNTLTWTNGAQSTINITTANQFSVQTEFLLTAVLKNDGKLYWNDGDIWQKAQPAVEASESIEQLKDDSCSGHTNLEEKTDYGDDDESDYVPLPCPVCGQWYAAGLLGIHLEGHFAFESCQLHALRAHATSDGENDLSADDALAARLQQEEIERSLDQFHALAGDRLAAMELERSFQAAESSPNLNSTLSASGNNTWTCLVCTLENEADKSACMACGKACARPTSETLETDAKAPAKVVQPRKRNVVAPVQPSTYQTKTRSETKAVSKMGNKREVVSKRETLPLKEAEVLSWAKARDSGNAKVVGDEYTCVTQYFMRTLGAADVKIHGLHRLAPGAGGASSFRPGGSQRIMFHGCKTLGNESAIVREGFKVSHCISGGPHYGTWMAYQAAYSDSGFAFNDFKGIRHMFMCMVSNAHVVLDNATMRVVGQGCAIPIWIVHYTHSRSAGAHTFNVGPYGRWGGTSAPVGTSAVVAAPYGWEARNGQWVPAPNPESRSRKK